LKYRNLNFFIYLQYFILIATFFVLVRCVAASLSLQHSFGDVTFSCLLICQWLNVIRVQFTKLLALTELNVYCAVTTPTIQDS